MEYPTGDESTSCSCSCERISTRFLCGLCGHAVTSRIEKDVAKYPMPIIERYGLLCVTSYSRAQTATLSFVGQLNGRGKIWHVICMSLPILLRCGSADESCLLCCQAKLDILTFRSQFRLGLLGPGRSICSSQHSTSRVQV